MILDVTRTSEWLEQVGPRRGATDDELDEAEAQLGITLPADYRTVMRQANGGDAEFGDS